MFLYTAYTHTTLEYYYKYSCTVYNLYALKLNPGYVPIQYTDTHTTLEYYYKDSCTVYNLYALNLNPGYVPIQYTAYTYIQHLNIIIRIRVYTYQLQL